MEIRPTKLNRAVAQIIEWTYGQTSIEFVVESSSFRRLGGEAPENHISYRMVTDVRRTTNIKHPGALAFEGIQLSITGIAVDNDGKMDDLLTPGDEDEIGSPPKDGNVMVAELPGLDGRYNMHLRMDNGGFATINVQILLYLYDGGQKSVSRTFIFRSNQMNQIR